MNLEIDSKPGVCNFSASALTHCALLACKSVTKWSLVPMIPLDSDHLEGRNGVSFHAEAPLPTWGLVCTKQCSVMSGLAVGIRERSLHAGEIHVQEWHRHQRRNEPELGGGGRGHGGVSLLKWQDLDRWSRETGFLDKEHSFEMKAPRRDLRGEVQELPGSWVGQNNDHLHLGRERSGLGYEGSWLLVLKNTEKHLCRVSTSSHINSRKREARKCFTHFTESNWERGRWIIWLMLHSEQVARVAWTWVF